MKDIYLIFDLQWITVLGFCKTLLLDLFVNSEKSWRQRMN
jgi:hypothetical protein